MGLFDTLSIDRSLLPATVAGESDGAVIVLPVPSENWQTKDLDCCLEHLRLGADGQLQRQRIDLEGAVGESTNTVGLLWSPTLPRCWVADTTTADLTCYGSVPSDADPQPHPTFPDARRSWSLRARIRLVEGRLQGSVQVDVDHVFWLEPVPGGGVGYRRLITDPQERARLAERERLRYVLSHRRLVDPARSLRRRIAEAAPSMRQQAAQLRALNRLLRRKEGRIGLPRQRRGGHEI